MCNRESEYKGVYTTHEVNFAYTVYDYVIEIVKAYYYCGKVDSAIMKVTEVSVLDKLSLLTWKVLKF